MKRQANVLSALITNFDTAEAAIEASANSAGSALRENEVYLDSIQGRIDLFNNSVQTMWKNTLDSDLVKDIVNLGTEIVKIIDRVGLLNSALLAFGAYKGFGALFKSLKADGVTLKSVWKWINQLTLATRQQQIADAAAAGTTLSRSNAEKFLNLSIIKRLTTEQMDAKVKEANRVREVALVGAKQALALAEEQYAEGLIDDIALQAAKNAVDAASIPINTVQVSMTTALGMAFKGLAASIWGATKAVLAFLFTNPVGWIILAIGAVAGGIAIFNHFHKTTAELAEELSNLKNELQDIETELDSLNSELETTQNRMAELLAMDSMSFVEEEELRKLKKQNDELQRKIDLQNSKKKEKQEDVANKFVETMNSDLNADRRWWNKRGHWWDEGQVSGKEKDKIDWMKTEYQSGGGANYDKAKNFIQHKLDQWGEYVKDVEYGINDEADAFLDMYYNLEDFYAINEGFDNAKANAIKRIFNKDEYSDDLEIIEGYIDALENGDTSAAKSIANIINNNDDLAKNLEAVGLSAQDAIDYFTKISKAPDSSTVEAITAQYAKGIDVLKKYKDAAKDANTVIGEYTNDDGAVEKITWSSLFDENGEVINTQISKVLQGADETARKEFARLAKSVNEGKITIDQAMAAFSAKGLVEGWKLVEAQVSELNTDVFKDLGDEISGIINTVSELRSAFESVADSIDLVNQAQAEMAYSGHLSVETALQLMESTDNWNELLTIEEGNIRLVDGAEKVLVQTKLDLIKKNLQTALSTVEAQLAQITATQSSADMATTIEESTNVAVQNLAGNMAYLTKIMEAYAKIAAGEDIVLEDYINAANTAKQEVLDQTNYKKNAAQAIGREGLEAEKARLEAMLKMYETVDTPSEFEDNWSSEKVSGGTKTKKEAEDKTVEDGWEKLISKYENQLALITNQRDLIQAQIDEAEARGIQVSSKAYDQLIENSQAEKALLIQKKAALEEYLQANKGSIDQDTWTEYNNEINETAVAIQECTTNIYEYAEALREIDTHYFEQTIDEISRLGEELDFVNSLLEDEEVADENGNWSSAALTRIGLYTKKMEEAAAKAKMYQDEIDKLNTQYKNGELSEEQYQEALSKLVSGQQDAIQSYEDAKDGIVELNEARIDAIKDGIEKEIEAYEDLIDLKKEELDAERDLYDFKKNVQKQTKDIAALERRIASLSGSTNASDIAERRKLQAELNEAKEGLNDTYYERSRDQQSQALDEEAEAFSESKEKYIEELELMLEDVETLISNSIMDVMLNADTVLAQLNDISATYGFDLSTALKQPWVDASAQAIAWKTELQNSMTSGEYAALIGEGGAITAFANGVATKLGGSWSSVQNKAQGYADFLTSAELGNRFSNTITSFANQIQLIIDKWNGVKTAADNAYTAQTRQVTVGGVNVSSPSGSGSSSGSSATSGGGGSSSGSNNVKALQKVLNGAFNAGLTVDGKLGGETTSAIKKAQQTVGVTADGKYGPATYSALQKYLMEQGRKYGNAGRPGDFQRYWGYAQSLPATLAKGTLGLTEDQLAITDESWIGEEITLAAGKNGQLQYLKKGSAVMPADITSNLVEWGKLNPNMLNFGGGANINMISNAINKPEIKLDIEEFLHVDKVDKDTMPELEKFVDKKMNDLVRQLNYSIKKFK